MKKPLETLSWQKFNSKASGMNAENRFSKGQGKPLRGLASKGRSSVPGPIKPVPLPGVALGKARGARG
jgi:hypothetical protein